VLQRIKRIEPRPAALIVAHRESTLRHCDSVLAIQHSPSENAEES
jgi:ABC-type multidrug transport system fused ATPase/permease subunit